MINDAGKHEVKAAASAVTLSACEDISPMAVPLYTHSAIGSAAVRTFEPAP